MKFTEQVEQLLNASYSLSDESSDAEHERVGELVRGVIAREKMLYDALLQITFEGPHRSVNIAQEAVAKACFWGDS